MTVVTAAIDFGATNTDVVVREGASTRRWTLPAAGPPDVEHVFEVLAAGGLHPDATAWIAVTGGDRSKLPATLHERPLRPVDEVAAIGRGGLALVEGDAALVVSAGSGTAVVAAHPTVQRHVTGTGVGGGTLLGLSRLLLDTIDPREIDALAQQGSHTGVNLTIGEILGGSIGSLPADTTAINFGRTARHAITPTRADLAAALINMVGQVIAVVAINAARAQQLEQIVVVGHLTDLAGIRSTLAEVGGFYGVSITLPPDGGYATALGALLVAQESAA